MKLACGIIFPLGFVDMGDGDLAGRLGCSCTITSGPYAILEFILLVVILDVLLLASSPSLGVVGLTSLEGTDMGYPTTYPAVFRVGTYS